MNFKALSSLSGLKKILFDNLNDFNSSNTLSIDYNKQISRDSVYLLEI